MNVIHFIKAGGFVMYPLLVLSFVAAFVIVERLLAFRQLGGLATGLLNQTIGLCRDGRCTEAAENCEKRSGPLAACLAVILRHRHLQTREIERLVEETGQEYFIRLERLLPILDTTTTISPLLGLLGTILGMVGTFNAIASQQSKSGGDAVLSGVGEALYATATGISIAVICFVTYNYFAARLRTITAETEQAATKLMNVLTEIHHEEQETARHKHSANFEESNEHGIQAAARA